MPLTDDDVQALGYSESRKSSMTSHLHSIYTSTFGILFFGTPHLGSSKAKLLGSLQKIVTISVPKKVLETDSNLLHALEEDSEILQNITDNFAPLLPRFRIFFFWEQERTDLKYTKDYIVDEVSAAPIVDGTDRSGIAADHRGMCKFDGPKAAGFRTVMAALQRYCREAPEIIKMRTVTASDTMKDRRWREATELVRSPPGGSDQGFGRGEEYVGKRVIRSVPGERNSLGRNSVEQREEVY